MLLVLEKSNFWLTGGFFEVANFLSTYYIHVSLLGCLFHLSKSYMRKIVELGLKKDYETNHEIALALKMLPSLAFENEEEIGNAYVPGAQSTGFSTKK